MVGLTEETLTSNKVPYEVGIGEYSELAKSMMEGSERGNPGRCVGFVSRSKVTLSTFNILSPKLCCRTAFALQRIRS
jgi:hypothetical protein